LDLSKQFNELQERFVDQTEELIRANSLLNQLKKERNSVEMGFDNQLTELIEERKHLQVG
jgi:hypothetical protein